jgi:large subunit ribosomal protein L4
MKVDIFDINGNKVSEKEVNFEGKFVDFNRDFMYFVINTLRKKYRVKTAHTKTKVAGSTRKQYKQKGTGNARRGAGDDPHFVGGRIIFGPLAIQRKVSIQKSQIQLARKMLLSRIFENGTFSIVQNVKIDSYKTKETVKIASTFGGKKFLCVHANEIEENNLVSARNLKDFSYSNVDYLTVFDLLKNDKFLITENALNKIVEIFE